MQSTQRLRLYSVCFVMLLIAVAILGMTMPISAQGGFATNTPAGDTDTDTDVNATEEAPASAPLFATNTPDPDSMGASGPEDILFNYALRFWLQPDFVELVFEQVEGLQADDTDSQLAVNLLLYEMETRFPDAPANPDQRLQLIDAMLNAPLGALDIRSIAYPFFQSALDSNTGDVFEVEGFTFELSPANLDGTGETDRLLRVTYQADDVIRYQEFLLAIADGDGSYTILPPTYDLPAVPFGGVESVSLEYLQDVDSDRLDEVVIRVDDGQASDRFFIVEARNGRAVDIVQLDSELRVGEVINWAFNTDNPQPPTLTLLEYQQVSDYPDWQCISEIEYSWQFDRNIYRRSVDLNENFENIDSLGCTLSEVDLFAMSPSEAITEVETALLVYGFDAPSANRALMTLSMLYALSGRLDDARNTAQSVITAGDDTTWESQQANALLRASNAAGNTALDFCEALAIASENPACDINAVLGRILDVIELDTDEDLVSQLEALGLPVLQSETVSTVGRADRIAIQFNIFGTDWWGFFDGRDGFYNVEPTDAPIAFAEAIFPASQLDIPQSGYDALLIENNPSRALTIINNTLSNSDGTLPLQPSALYVQALAYDLTGDRENARATYYEIWETYPESVWGEIASTHLELR